jgi:organic hydroperoxide reductase OsmC/OhrA
MSEHTIALEWTRNTPDFNYETYSRNHTVTFGTVGKVCGSSAPEFHGDPQCLDPEQAFVTALSSCHMLTFLAIASKKGYIVDHYRDHATGEIGKDKEGRSAVVKVVLRPEVVFSGPKMPDGKEFQALHDRAHKGCIIANSVASCVELTVTPILHQL